MNLRNKYGPVIAIVLTVLVLIVIRLLSPGHFKIDARKWAEPSVLRSNIITVEQIKSLPGQKLIINLGGENSAISMIVKNVINVAPDSLLNRKNLNSIKNHDGPVLLFSSEASVSARVWMLLSEMGYRNIFVITNDANNEILNYKFRPDTMTKPDL